MAALIQINGQPSRTKKAPKIAHSIDFPPRMPRLLATSTDQKLQTALHAKAKAEAGYRFYALYDKINRRAAAP